MRVMRIGLRCFTDMNDCLVLPRSLAGKRNYWNGLLAWLWCLRWDVPR